MKIRKILLLTGLIAVFTMLIPGSQVLAGGGPEIPIPGSAQKHGPEVWGEVTVFCSDALTDFLVVRVKRINDCNVETQTLVDPAWGFGCPANETAPVNWSMPPGTQFWDIAGTPYIEKVKNFKMDVVIVAGDPAGQAYSFDAQFRFWSLP